MKGLNRFSFHSKEHLRRNLEEIARRPAKMGRPVLQNLEKADLSTSLRFGGDGNSFATVR
jgi:hypothetical protein